MSGEKVRKIDKTDAEWARTLSPESYQVCRKGATEPPFTGEYVYHKEDGTYHCKACGNPLFTSREKYDSGSGWPSFYDLYNKENILEKPDTSHGMIRTEVLCAACNSHLGHLFSDGPPPTGKRYCINSLALSFKDKIQS